jgi:PAS domain S-box-containing protein
MSIINHLLVVHQAGLMVVIALVMIGASYLSGQNFINHQRQAAILLSQRVAEHVSSAGNMLKALAAMPPSQFKMDALLQTFGTFDVLYHINANGRLVEISPKNPQMPPGMDLSAQPYLNPPPIILSISAPFISSHTGNPTVYMSVPIPSTGGILVGELNLDRLQRSIVQTNILASGVLYLTDQFGNLLAYPQVERVQQVEDIRPLGILERLEQGHTLQVYRVDGKWVVGIIEKLPLTGWLAIAQAPIQDIYGPFFFTALLGLLLSSLLFLLSIWREREAIARQAVEPLQELGQAAQRLADGDYSAETLIYSQAHAYDEVASLADSFARMETAIKSRERDLIESEERFRLAMDAAQDGLWDWDIPSGRSQYSPGYFRMLGCEPGEFGQDAQAWQSRIHPEDLPRVMAVNQECIENRSDGFEVEYRMLSKTGEWVWILSRGKAISRAPDGKALRLVGTHVDLTDRKRFEQYLQEMNSELEKRVALRTRELSLANSELERASRLKDDFLASMSHELRTPLTGILGLSEALRARVYGEINERQYTALHNIQESGEHLLSLINDILDLSKVEAGKIVLDMRPTTVENVLYASLRLVKQNAQKKHLKIETQFDTQVKIILADERRLKQILVNLLGNAVKFTPEGGSIGVTVRGDPQRKVLHFTVWDTGIGIAPQDHERLFKPFVQLDGGLSRQFDGTGLGLALVYRLVDLHGGSISMHSTVGAGSQFTVTLPWQAVELTPGGAGQASPVEMALATVPLPEEPVEQLTPGECLRVLVAEDNEVTLQMLTDFLQTRGCQVTQARNGAEVLELARDEQVEVVVLDIQLPVLNGHQVLKIMRLQPETATIPVIALTALARPGDEQACLDAGANAYLSKPVDLQKLVEIIRQKASRISL